MNLHWFFRLSTRKRCWSNTALDCVLSGHELYLMRRHPCTKRNFQLGNLTRSLFDFIARLFIVVLCALCPLFRFGFGVELKYPFLLFAQYNGMCRLSTLNAECDRMNIYQPQFTCGSWRRSAWNCNNGTHPLLWPNLFLFLYSRAINNDDSTSRRWRWRRRR